MTQEQRRIKILEKRLLLLAEYLEKFERDGDNPTFAQFIKMRGVTYPMFIKDLPPGYENVPASGYDDILEYAVRLHELLKGQHRIMEMSADGEDLGAGLMKYEGDQSFEKGCGCGCNGSGCGDENNHDDEHTFNASGKICIKPIAPIIPEKINPGMWRSYRNKITAYNKCVADKKSAGGYTLQDKASHALHLSNPSEATGRAAFLRLVEYNIFGLGSTFEKMRQDPNQSHWNEVKKKWYRMGGSEKKLDQNVSIGRNKKPVFKPKGWKPKGGTVSADGNFNANGGEWYNAEAWTAAGIAGLIVAATGMLATMAPVIKNFKKEKGEPNVEFDGSVDLNREGDVPDGMAPDGELTEGQDVATKIAMGIGVALVVTALGFGIYKMATK